MACGCQAACGCDVQAGAGILVQRLGDRFVITNTAVGRVVQTESADATVAIGTTHLVFEGATPAQTATAQPAIAGAGFEVWNVSSEDLELAADGAELVNGVASVTIPSGYSADVFSPADGEWLANVH